MMRGYTSYTVASTRDGRPAFTERASAIGGFNAGAGNKGSTAGARTLGLNLENEMLDGFVDTKNELAMRNIYRDMYHNDPVAGAAVDIMSNLPFSDVTLGGVRDRKALEPFVKSIENLRLKSLLPGMSVDYLALGEFIGSLAWNGSKRIFDSVMPQNADNIDFKTVPVYGMDPIMDLKFSKDMIKLLSDKDPRVQKVLNNLPARVKEGMRKGRVELEPASTLHMARRSFSYETRGTSIFRRLVPIYLLEKALMRGTIEQSYRRQRAIMHLMVGDEEWNPTPEEMQHIGGLFSSADVDPTNSIVVTPLGVQVGEVKRGDDFWRYDSIYDFASSAKMRALGINEAFLSGDANYNNMETSLSVFLDQLRAYREMVTREIFYEKLFPAIAVANNLRKLQRHAVTADEERSRRRLQVEWQHLGTKIISDRAGNFMALCSGDSVVDPNTIEDITQYQIPTIEWHKQLKPEADAQYMEMLDQMAQHGLPIPLRLMAAAGGLSIEEILNAQEEDIETRTQVKDYFDQIKQLAPEQLNQTGGQEEARLRDAVLAAASGNGVGRRLGQRKFDPEGAGTPRNIQSGKRHLLSAKGRKLANERTNRIASAALARIAQRHNHQIRAGA